MCKPLCFTCSNMEMARHINTLNFPVAFSGLGRWYLYLDSCATGGKCYRENQDEKASPLKQLLPAGRSSRTWCDG